MTINGDPAPTSRVPKLVPPKHQQWISHRKLGDRQLEDADGLVIDVDQPHPWHKAQTEQTKPVAASSEPPMDKRSMGHKDTRDASAAFPVQKSQFVKKLTPKRLAASVAASATSSEAHIDKRSMGHKTSPSLLSRNLLSIA